MNKPNDFYAILMYNDPSSFEDIVANGITPENTTIQSADYYKNLDPVKEKFTKGRKFDETAFMNSYNSSLAMYNEFSNTD